MNKKKERVKNISRILIYFICKEASIYNLISFFIRSRNSILNTFIKISNFYNFLVSFDLLRIRMECNSVIKWHGTVLSFWFLILIYLTIKLPYVQRSMRTSLTLCIKGCGRPQWYSRKFFQVSLIPQENFRRTEKIHFEIKLHLL